MVHDNGGAIAQKGFNYQNHVISLVAIRNYQKNNFEIFVESADDFEVLYDDNYHAYIQVKGQKRVSINNLLKVNTDNCSIFEKNLTPGDENSKYKIVVFHFSQKDLSVMQENTEDELFEYSWTLREKERKDVFNKLPEAFRNKDNNLETKLSNFSLVKTSFSNNIVDARKYLKGELVTQKISVDGRDDLILDELDRVIRQKSEYILKDDDDKKFKRISSNELQAILKKVSSKASFERELEEFPFTTYRKAIIKREEIKIIHQYMYEKRQVIGLLESDKHMLETKQLTEIAEEIKSESILQHLEDNTRYAIIASAYCDIIEGVANEPINYS